MLRIFPFDKTGVSEAVAQFEKNHDILLPEEYRTFLINYNGGNTLQTSLEMYQSNPIGVCTSCISGITNDAAKEGIFLQFSK